MLHATKYEIVTGITAMHCMSTCNRAAGTSCSSAEDGSAVAGNINAAR